MIYRVDYDSSEETSVDNKEHLLHPLKIIKLNTFTPFRLIILQGELVKNTDRQTDGGMDRGRKSHPSCHSQETFPKGSPGHKWVAE